MVPQIIADLASGITPEIDIEGFGCDAHGALFLNAADWCFSAIKCRVAGRRQADRRRSIHPGLLKCFERDIGIDFKSVDATTMRELPLIKQHFADGTNFAPKIPVCSRKIRAAE